MRAKIHPVGLCFTLGLMLSFGFASCTKKDNGQKRSTKPAPEGRAGARSGAGQAGKAAVPAGVRERVLKEMSRLDGERETMRSVAQTLQGIGPAAVPVLTGVLSAPDVGRRRKAAMALGLMGNKAVGAVPALVKALADLAPTPQPQWREDVVYALGMIGVRTADVVKAVTSALSDKVTGVRRAAVRVLGRMGPAAAPAVPALALRLTDAHFSVRKAAARALGNLGSLAKSVLPALQKAGRDDPDERVKKAALKAVARIQSGR